MSTAFNDDESIAKEVDEGLEEDEAEEPQENQHKKPNKKKNGKKAIGAPKPPAAKATAVKTNGAVAKKPKDAKAPKPRRPFSRISDEDLLRRQGMIKERLDVAQAQITIMTSKWNKYEDEKMIREQLGKEAVE